jgi:SAM-dependent methyltransferase
MLAEARRLNPGSDLRIARADAVPFEDASFDAVLCVEVLRYLPDVAPCIGEIARVLKPGGVALVTASPLFNLNGYPLFNRAALWVPWGRAVRLKQFFHTSFGLRRRFRHAGLREVATHGIYLGVVNWAERLVPGRLGAFLRSLESLDGRASDLPLVRDLSAMLLVHAIR